MKIIRLFKRTPVTTSGVLKQALTALQKEGRWVKGSWLQSQGTSIDPDAPLCGGWGACAEGFVDVTIFGIPAYDHGGGVCHITGERFAGAYDQAQWDLRDRAIDLLNQQAKAAGFGCIVDLNDAGSTTRDDVERMFAKAYRRAQYLERIGTLPKAKDLVAA